MARGRLRMYLGMAPGVGKTYAMLSEGQRGLARGKDVVVGVVETHGRPETAKLLDGLEVVPRRSIAYRGTTFTEMDVDAVLARRPQLALVDELAHTNIPGSRHAKRWEDVEELLAAGIDVITTVNIQHLESLNDVIERITGVVQKERIPDEVARRADAIELVDMSPEALRRRMAHGNVYPSDRIDASLANYFRPGNLIALRELALLWVAGRVDEALQRYRHEHSIDTPWETTERVVVGLTGGPEGDTLIRRGARIVARVGGGELLAVHVSRSDGLSGASPKQLAKQRVLVEQLGGGFHQVVGDDPATAMLDFARAENATQVVVGASRRGRFSTFLTGEGVSARVVRESGPIDVHIVTHEKAGRRGGPALPAMSGGLTVARQIRASIVGVLLLVVLTAILIPLKGPLNLTTELLLYLVAVVAIGLMGGMWPALGAAVVGTLLVNFFFTPPLHTLTINERNNIIALGVFLAVAVMVSLAVNRAAERTRRAARAAAEAQTLASLAGSVLRGNHGLPALLEQIRETFGLSAVALTERTDDGWHTVRSTGEVSANPEVKVQVGERFVLVGAGRLLPASDRRVLDAFATHAAAALERGRLAEQAAEAAGLAATDRLRTALLRAVGHDLRSPLASAKAAVSSLRGHDVAWSEEERDELLATADESLDRLHRLVDNLLDMSRLQAGVLSVSLAPTGVDEIAVRAVDSLGPLAAHVEVRIPDALPAAHADPVLAERVVANLVGNAVKHSPADRPPLVTASWLGEALQLRVVDHGPGVPPAEWDRIFTPFQRLGDRGTGVGLGLALSRGLAEAMGGTLVPEETPGGGLTMVLTLPAVATDRVPGPSTSDPLS
ncbi:MAG TPA: sensor histidine kinase KdpD [Actinocatenispora sp.]